MPIQHGSARATRPKQKTPAERGAEFAAEQQRLKREAAERRAAAAKSAVDEGDGDAKPRKRSG